MKWQRMGADEAGWGTVALSVRGFFLRGYFWHGKIISYFPSIIHRR